LVDDPSSPVVGPSCMIARLLATAAMAAQATALEASCHCGSVVVRVLAGSSPQARSICHCQTCRSLSGAPFLANLVLPAHAVDICGADGGEANLVTCKTSKHVTRKRCASCFSPVVASLGPKRIVVPMAMFSPGQLPADWAPEHHLYYDQRVLDVNDDLPKFSTHFGGKLWSGQAADVGGDQLLTTTSSSKPE